LQFRKEADLVIGGHAYRRMDHAGSAAIETAVSGKGARVWIS
jgi:hypothetical protein